MKEIKNQYGFATLEIILVVAIVGIFSTVAVPKMEQIFDKVCLNYETKSLYSNLNLARSIGKSSTFKSGIFGDVENPGHNVEFWIYGKNYSTVGVRNRYSLMRPSLESKAYFIHKLGGEIELDFMGGNKVLKISFDNPSRYSNGFNSKTLTLTSKFKNKTQIIFDSVGRWRGEYVK